MNGINATCLALAALALSAFTSPARAADPEALAKEKQCFACHAIDKERQAPSFRLLARNYRNAPNADRMLERKVVLGGVGHWGKEPMPAAGARPAVSEDEARELVAWILSLN